MFNFRVRVLSFYNIQREATVRVTVYNQQYSDVRKIRNCFNSVNSDGYSSANGSL